MPSEAEWKKAFPVPSSVSYRGMVELYAKHGGAQGALDDILDGRVPEPWRAEVGYAVDHGMLVLRRIERLAERFERALLVLERAASKAGPETRRGR
jgi:hypothetical protein